MNLMASIKKWAESKGGWAHISAAIFAFLMLAFASDRQFHHLVMSAYQSLPTAIKELIVTGVGLWAFYKKTEKQSAPQDSPKENQ